MAGELRSRAEAIEPDPERLAWVQHRRQQLRDLHRKYADLAPEGTAGAGRVAALLAVQASLGAELERLGSHGERVAALEAARDAVAERLGAEEGRVLDARRVAAPRLARATEELLAELAMPRVRLDVEVTGSAGDGAGPGTVTFLLSANPGAPLLPLAKVASGGELARVMLALRLALDGGGAGPGDPDRAGPPATGTARPR